MRLQKSLEQTRTIFGQIKKKPTEGQPVTSELALLSTLEDETRATHLLLQERFKEREEKIKTRGADALKRHQVSWPEPDLTDSAKMGRMESSPLQALSLGKL